MSRKILFILSLMLLSSCGASIRDMSCIQRCEHDYNSSYNQINMNDHLGQTEKNVEGWEADKRRSECQKKCSASSK